MSVAPADPTPIRLGLLNEGYQPTPICPPGCTHVDKRGTLCKSGGKAVHIAGWTKGAATARDVHSWQRTRPRDTNTGILTGDMVGVDADILDPSLAAQVDNLAEQYLGPTPLRRIGRAPKWLRCYRAETPMPKLETPERRLNGETIQVEIMGKGQQVAAYGIHPTTMRPYTWIDRQPLDVPLAELPVVSEDQLRAFLAATDALFVAAGAKLRVPPKAAASGPHVNRQAAAGANGASGSTAGDFFQNVNQAALANISPWFTAIFPRATQEPRTGAWRISSADLGRSLEKDLSMHPTEGGKDFGTREPLSPITTAMRWGGAPDAKAAAFWLCKQLGKNPADLGWKEPTKPADRPNPKANGAARHNRLDRRSRTGAAGRKRLHTSTRPVTASPAPSRELSQSQRHRTILSPKARSPMHSPVNTGTDCATATIPAHGSTGTAQSGGASAPSWPTGGHTRGRKPWPPMPTTRRPSSTPVKHPSPPGWNDWHSPTAPSP